MMDDKLLYTFIFIISIYYIIGAGIFKLGFNTRRTQRLINLIGEPAARIFFIVVGIVFIILGYYKAF